MTSHPSAIIGATQCDLILDRLQETPGEWVAMPALVRVSGSYVIHSRIADLRARGHRNLRLGRAVHSEYRLAEDATNQTQLFPASSSAPSASPRSIQSPQPQPQP